MKSWKARANLPLEDFKNVLYIFYIYLVKYFLTQHLYCWLTQRKYTVAMRQLGISLLLETFA